jgi:pimeloyl-ACP methyl ester carboxylesterase
MHRIMRRLGRPEPTDMLLRAMASFRHQGQRLAYRSFGSGSRAVILLPGILLPARMHEPLAGALAERGNRVILLDLLGHGQSRRWSRSWTTSSSTRP